MKVEVLASAKGKIFIFLPDYPRKSPVRIRSVGQKYKPEAFFLNERLPSRTY
jgi:hypothetical protein